MKIKMRHRICVVHEGCNVQAVCTEDITSAPFTRDDAIEDQMKNSINC